MTRRHLVAGAALATLLLPACSSSDEVDLTAPTQTRASADAPVTTLVGDGPLVVVLGDSNTYGTAPELHDSLSDAGFTPDVRGISGSGLFNNGFDWLPAAAAVTVAQPALVVIALGTNDAVNDADVAAFPVRAEELLAALGDLPIVWVTHTESGGAHAPADEKRINDAIRALPGAHPNVTVLDLAPFIAAQPDLLGDDRLHYEGEGREFFADQIAATASARVNPPAS